jgi:CubicO group peptidase (beta-lactamase class C family)
MLRLVQATRKAVNAIVVARNGRLAVEAYFPPYRSDTPHDIQSCTKSITSALVGIAMRQGHLRDVHQTLVEFFPELAAAEVHPRKREITLAHVLTMTTGLGWREWGVPYGNRDSVSQMHRSGDWVRFVLGRPLVAAPGTRFDYNTGASHLLSAIIQERTGRATPAFAQEYLFGPLGIEPPQWATDSKGIANGGSGLRMTPRDLAKIGQLFLRGGVWGTERLVPASWIAESTRPHVNVVATSDLRYRTRVFLAHLLRRTPPVAGELRYGYHWWIPPFGGYAARGLAGQALFVLPVLDMVVVFTGGLGSADTFLPERLVRDFVIPSARRGGAHPPDRERRSTAIESLLGAPSAVEATTTLPRTAEAISGRTFVLGRSGAMQSLSLRFAGGREAMLRISQGGRDFEVAVGLDDVFRHTAIVDRGEVAVRGRWLDERTFAIEWCPLGSGDRLEFRLTFRGDRVTMHSHGSIDGRVTRVDGRTSRVGGPPA